MDTQKYLSKVSYVLFWISVGGLLATQLITQFVIAPYADDSNPGWLTVYNLFDHLAPYDIAFVLGILVFGLIFTLSKSTLFTKWFKDLR